MKKYIIGGVLLLFFTQLSVVIGQSDSAKNWLKYFELKGYFQFQYHYTDKDDSVSLHAMTAGDFARFNNNKFAVRRSRIRFEYHRDYASSAISFDVTERGMIIKDAWLAFKDPWFKGIEMKMGVYALPFGHEIELPSLERETPERSRVVQHLFPGIRDIGTGFRFQLPETNAFHALLLDAGIFHGTSGNIEADNAKDFVGRLFIDKPLKSDKVNFSMAYSFLNGKVNHQYDIDGSISNYHYIYRMLDTTVNVNGEDRQYSILFQDYLPNELDDLIKDSVTGYTPATFNKFVTRRYHGVSGQVDLNLSIGAKKIGKTMIRGEYIWGVQVSQEGTLGNPYVFNSMTPTGPFVSVTWPKFDSPQPYNPAAIGKHLKPSHTFIRNFRGMYFYIDQQIGKTGHHLVYKYDYYDPNTAVSGEDIRLNIEDDQGNIIGSSGLSVADVAFKTHGFGYRYVFADNRLSCMLFYENPRNEKTLLEPLNSSQINLGKNPHTGFLTDIKDDVFTIRVQYIF
jgi:hypothetical protein